MAEKGNKKAALVLRLSEFGPSVSTAVTTVVVLIFGEVTPKSIAKEVPEKDDSFEFGNLLGSVLEMEGKRVGKVRIILK